MSSFLEEPVGTSVDRVIDSLIVALQEYSDETLDRVADEAVKTNPDGWLGKMIREYLSVWRGQR